MMNREVEVTDEVNLNELIEMLKATHTYVTGNYLMLTDITFSFREKETGCERAISIGSKTSRLE